jgi:hypothetical protein
MNMGDVCTRAKKTSFRRAAFAALFCVSMSAWSATAEPITVRQPEGVVHGFVTVRSMDGKRIADGEITQSLVGKHLNLHVNIRFIDGSRHEDKVTFDTTKTLRLVRQVLVQQGPSFATQIESAVDAEKGTVRVAYTDDKGKSDTIEERMDIPPDVGNGLLLTAVKHADPSGAESTISWVAATPKPRLVSLVISALGKEPVTHGTIKTEAVHYVVKTHIGGLAGLVAPLVGKQPPDIHVWMLAGGAPGFLKFEGPLQNEGPIWRIEMSAPKSN